MQMYEKAMYVLQAAKELTEQDGYFFFFDADELAVMLDTAYLKCPDIELDREIIGYMKDTLRTVTNAGQIVRSAFMEIDSH